MESLVGRTLGKYELTAMIGGGGMATVYKARHPGLDQPVAVKILHPFLSTDASFVDRFRREAHAVAALRHPNIVRVMDSDHEDQLYYMVMEFISGPTLSTVLSGRRTAGGLSLPEIGRIFPPLCSAIDYAAGRGMVHRDIKPANIIMTDEGDPILTDYGIAKMIGSTSLTSPGTVVGSAHYMSPEQAQGQECDVRSDLYSLGVVLFECLAGSVPFDGDTTATVLIKHISAPIPSIRSLRPNLPLSLEPMLMRALAKAPRDRYEMGVIFAEELLVALTPSKSTAAVTELVAGVAPLTAAPTASPPTPPAQVSEPQAAPAPPPPPPPFAPPPTPPSTPIPTPPVSTSVEHPVVQTAGADSPREAEHTPSEATPPPVSTSVEQPAVVVGGFAAQPPVEPTPGESTPVAPPTTDAPPPAAQPTPPPPPPPPPAPDAPAPSAWPRDPTAVERTPLAATSFESFPADRAAGAPGSAPAGVLPPEPAPAPQAGESTPPPVAPIWSQPPPPPPPPSSTWNEPTTPTYGTAPVGRYAPQPSAPAAGGPYAGVPAAAGARGGAPPRRGNRNRIIMVAALAVVLLAAVGTATGMALRGGDSDPTTTTLAVTTTDSTVLTTTTTRATTTSRSTTTTVATTTTTVKPTTTTAKPTTTTKRQTTTTKRQTTTTKRQTTTTKKPTTTQTTGPPPTIGPGTTSPPPTIGPG